MKEYFYTITESMLDLGLRGTELNLFAIIFGYSQKGDGCCYATRAELAKRCGVSSTRTIDTAFSSLVSKGLVKKVFVQHDGLIVTAWSCCANSAQGAQKLRTPHAQKLRSGCANSAHKENKVKTDILAVYPKKTDKGGRFAPPSVDEVRDFCLERGNNIDAEAFVAFYTSKGWKIGSTPMKDWRAAVITWEKRHANDATTAAPSRSRKSKADEAFDSMMELGKELGL